MSKRPPVNMIEGPVVKGGKNPPNTSSWRPPPPGGSGGKPPLSESEADSDKLRKR